MLDPSGRFTFVNRRGALAVLGYEPDEIVGQHFSVFAAGADPNQDLVRFDEIMLSRGVSTIETRWRRKDGQNVFVTINVAVTRDAQGHNVAALGTASDVTERVIREKALRDANRLANEAARSKAEFLATMSHELRTPLNGVIASTELLCGTMLSIEQAEYVATIQTSGESLLAVINDVLDLSKIEAGRVDLERTPFVLEGMIDAVVDILGERAREKGLELLYDLAASVPAVVSGDAARLRQIVLNLVANAVKFTHSGLVRVSVDALAATADAITVEISVSDTGIGMDQTTLDRLFQPFSQADSSTTRRYGGTGLGLAISKRLAIMMGGGIRAQSSLHRGSTFTVTVRLGVADANTAAVSELGGSDANLDALRAALAGKRIVMIDPLPARRALLLGWLRPWAAQVRVVESFEPRCDLRVDGVVPDAVVVVTAGGIADSAVAQADHEFRGVKSAAVALNVPILWLAGQSRGRLVAARATDPSAAQTIELLTRPVRRRVLLVALERLIARSGVAGEVPARHDARSTLAPPAGARTIAATGATLGSTVGSTTEPISAPAAKIGAGFCVLVAEDHEINQRIAIRMLQKLGCQVDLAVNGREALSRATLTQYDIVFMDMQMPEMDGVQATRAIRTAVGPADAPPIVAMTANALAEDRSRCLIAGMQDFLTKPINGASLERALVEWARPRYLARTSPLFDARQLDGLRALGADRARHVVALYVHDTTEKLERLRAALALGDHATIVAISHSVYGASSTLGALRAACIAQSLEAAARADDDIAMTAQIASLAGAVAETIVGLPRLFMPVDALGASLGHSLAPSL